MTHPLESTMPPQQFTAGPASQSLVASLRQSAPSAGLTTPGPDRSARTAEDGSGRPARLRVAVISETYPPEINGVALTVATLARGLRDAGHEALVIRPQQHDEACGRASPGEWVVPGGPLPRYRELRFGWPVYGRLRRCFAAERFDALYVATEGPLGWAAVWAARRLGIPIASGFHTRFDDFVAHYGLGWLQRSAFAYLRAFHNRASTTLVPTEQLRSELLSGGFRDVRILARGVDCQAFDPTRRSTALRQSWGLAEHELAVLFVGRIAPEKNLGLVVRSFEAIRARGIPARMIWVGDGPARAELAAAHPDHVWCGMRRGEELGAHYASADLFLFPSLTETFGNVTLEALASGIASITFHYAAARQHVRDGHDGRTVAFDDSEAFVDAAVQVAGDAELRTTLAHNARRTAESLAPGAVSERFADLLLELTRSPR
jgi:glycosyltransferase involved in cell wall biosynthesis